MSSPSSLEDIHGVVQALRRITKAIHEFSKAVDREFGITGPQLWAMRTINELGGCSAGDLAARLCVHPSTVTGVIQRLEEKRLIDRQKRAEDRRAVVLTLTPNGKKLLERAPHPAQGQLVAALQGMAPDDVHKLREMLVQIVDSMELGNVSARFFFSEEE
ncbi:MarR family winged helix-turn-helix transcriptional regulator [Vulgatibacter sp.]|uniref:MarR family winged helix-turn-helix transcriptional regulator n=1 Tax=Vulgatibacter sp. TaxID=1971226 RepID=UPI00356AEAE6